LLPPTSPVPPPRSGSHAEAISAAGVACPAFLILSGQMVMSSFVQQANQTTDMAQLIRAAYSP
jgi:hypothetical protein